MERKATTYETADGVAVITLNRPERLNAWTARMEHEYRASLAEADRDPDVRVVIVTGAGRGFCAGADSRALEGIVATGRYGDGGASGDEADVPRLDIPPELDHTMSFPLAMRKPLIAAVNGPAAGIGLVLLCFADIRFAARGAKLTTSFGRLGLPAEHGISWVLPRLVGLGRAADLLFSSRVVLAEEAKEMGLVNEVFEPEELLPRALDYARRMAAEISPWSLQMMKRQLWAAVSQSLHDAATEAEGLMRDAFSTPDFTEGVAALTEKRPPRFEGLHP